MSNCKGVVKTECLPPVCSWADGQTRKYCRAKHNKAKKSPKAKKAKSPRMPGLDPPTPSAIERFVRETGIQVSPPRVKTPKSKKVKKAKTPKVKKVKTPKAKGVEKWKVTDVEVWFPMEESKDEDNDSVYNIANITVTGPKQQKIVYHFKDEIFVLNDDNVNEGRLTTYKLSANVGKETAVSVDSLKLHVHTDDLTSINDEVYGGLKRGVIKITSSRKAMKEHLSTLIHKMLV